MKVTNKVKIYLDDRHLIPPVDVMQGDTNTRVLEMELYEAGTAWDVPEDASVAVAYRRADGSKGIYDTLPDGSTACTVSGNMVTAVLVPQALAVPGNTLMTVVFTDDTGKQLATFCVLLRVERNPAVGAMEPEDYYNIRQWVTAGPMYVALTQNGGVFAVDKTYAEIVTAHEAGQTVYCLLAQEYVLPLVAVSDASVLFQETVNREYQRVVIKSDDTITYNIGKYALLEELPYEYWVNVTQVEDGTYTADKTFDEIYAASQTSSPVVCRWEREGNSVQLALTQIVPSTMAVFTTTLDGQLYRAVIATTGVSVEVTAISQDAQYYASLSAAIADINHGVSTNRLADLSAAKVKVFTSDTGVLTVILLDDVSESGVIIISKSCDIVLNGHKLNFTNVSAYLSFGEGIDCTIWGNVDGSAIVKDAITSTNASTVSYFVTAKAAKVKLVGGEYIHRGDIAGHMMGIATSATCNSMEIDGATITIENTRTTSSGVVYGVQNGAVELIVRNSTVVANGVTQNLTAIRNNTILTLEKSTVKTTISADGALNLAYAITNTGTLTAEDSYVLADGKGINAEDDECAVGIRNAGTAYLKNMTVNGCHSGMGNNGNLYISGGTYTGYCHGGIYFAHGADGIGYVNDATIRDGHYEGAFTDYFDTLTDHSWGGFYVGGGSDTNHSNMTVYMDNCTIEGVSHAFVMRGSSGETNNTINLSNCTIVDGVNKPINFHNTTHVVNVGTGGNITSEMATEPTCLNFTGKLYRKMHGNRLAVGNDYNALVNYLNTLES